MNARPIHAVMLTPSARGGHARYTLELMTALRDVAPPSEVRLTLLTSEDLDPEFRTSRYDIASVLPPLKHRSLFSNRVAWAASRIAHYAMREELVLRWVRAQGCVDVLHYQEPPFGAPLHFVRARAAGPNPVATVHNLRPHTYRIDAARSMTDFVARLGWMQCATLFVHSAGLKAQLSNDIGHRAPPILVIPHGVWTRHRARATTPNRDGYLLLFGVMRPNKGVLLMLDALRFLPGKRLVLAGAFEDRSLAAEVRKRIAVERLPVAVLDRVVPQTELAHLFAGAALIVLPYIDFHGQSGVLHLGISYGVPVVVTDVGALGEHVRQERIGAVAPPNDAAAFARTVMQALEPIAHDAAHHRCTQLARTLSWSAAAQITLDAYRAFQQEPQV